MSEPNLFPTRPAVAREKALREKLKEQSLQIQVLVDEIERLRSSTSERYETNNNNNENIDLQNNKIKNKSIDSNLIDINKNAEAIQQSDATNNNNNNNADLESFAAIQQVIKGLQLETYVFSFIIKCFTCIYRK